MQVGVVALGVGVVAFPMFARAADTSVEDVLSGFDSSASASSLDATQKEDRWWDLTGEVFVKSAYNFAQHHPHHGEPDYSGLSKLQLGTRLQLDLKLPHEWEARISGRAIHDFAYSINGRGDYTSQVLNLHEQIFELQDTYVRGKLLPNLDLKFGRQVVNWGRSDSLRVLDVLNPLDNREPGLVDLEDLRLPVTMTKLDYYWNFLGGEWDLSAIAIHERRFDAGPAYGSDFYPSSVRMPRAKDPADWQFDYEYGAALTGTFSGWDFSLHYARFYTDQPYIELVPIPVFPFVRPRADYARVSMYGASFNVVSGSWLFKGEAGYFTNMRFLGDQGREHDRVDVMVGVEYMGFSKTTIAFEAVNRHIRGYDSAMMPRRNSTEFALRYTRDFLNDTLHVTALGIWFDVDAEDGSMIRLSGEYDLTDAITLGAGVIFYNSGEMVPFDSIDRNDRAFLEVKYSF